MRNILIVNEIPKDVITFFWSLNWDKLRSILLIFFKMQQEKKTDTNEIKITKRKLVMLKRFILDY